MWPGQGTDGMWTDLWRANKFDDVESEDREREWGISKPNDP